MSEDNAISLEESKQRAESGDISSMIYLGDYYFDRKEYDCFEEAEYWYKKAANAGNLYGMIQAAMVAQILTEINQLLSIADWELALEYAQSAKFWANRVLEQFQDVIDSSTQSIAENTRNNALYSIGVSYYHMNQYSQAVDALQSLSGTEAQILKGICLYRQMPRNREDLQAAYVALKVIEQDHEYVINQKTCESESIFCVACVFLSSFYRIGLNGIVSPNMNKSVEILTLALQTMQEASCKKILLDELSHYQKRVFGGYKYV